MAGAPEGHLAWELELLNCRGGARDDNWAADAGVRDTGELLVSGYVQEDRGERRYHVVELSPAGEVLAAARSRDGSARDPPIRAVSPSGDGGAVLERGATIVKLDDALQVEWQRVLPSWLEQVAAAAAPGVFVSGGANGGVAGRLDADGNAALDDPCLPVLDTDIYFSADPELHEPALSGPRMLPDVVLDLRPLLPRVKAGQAEPEAECEGFSDPVPPRIWCESVGSDLVVRWEITARATSYSVRAGPVACTDGTELSVSGNALPAGSSWILVAGWNERGSGVAACDRPRLAPEAQEWDAPMPSGVGHRTPVRIGLRLAPSPALPAVAHAPMHPLIRITWVPTLPCWKLSTGWRRMRLAQPRSSERRAPCTSTQRFRIRARFASSPGTPRTG